MSIAVGSQAPDFTLISNTREPVSLASLRGRKTLIVFIPAPFTGTCTKEVCELQENHAQLSGLDANVVVITCDTVPTNAKWAELEGLEFPILSDYWPHGAVSQSYETFNDKVGMATRSTYVLDEEGIITAIVSSDSPREARNYDTYVAALG